jgi:hypothetical protein
MRRALLLLLFSSLASADNSARPPPRCTLRPLKLVVRAEKRVLPMITLDAKGQLSITRPRGQPLTARFDPRGCVIGPDGVWTERSKGKLWTPHEVLDIEGSAIRIGNGAALRIAKDGTVERVSPDGTVEQSGRGALVIEGYSESAVCAAQLLLGVFLQSMPSMAVSDGNLQKLPPLPDSPCASARP